MLTDALEVIRTASEAYRQGTSFAQRLTIAFLICGYGLACIILPDVLAAFGITVAHWKNVLFTVYGAVLWGAGLGQILFPLFISRKSHQPEQQASPNNAVE